MEYVTQRVVVVGGANTDIVGVPVATLLGHDSNPGHIRVSAGGVARNIAENLSRLGVPVSLLTAFGCDDAGRTLRNSCTDAGVDTSLSLVAADLPGAHYLAILDEKRDMSVAVNDMRVLELLTPDALADPARERALASADVVVLDTNLPVDAIEWIAAHTAAMIVLDPVSVAKAPRALDILAGLAAIAPNAAEAAVLLGHPVEGLGAAVVAAREFVQRGIGAAFVTCGEEGTAWADARASGTVPKPDVTVANASGAGDAFCAGIAWAILAGADARRAAIAGRALAAIALADEDTVSRRITPETADVVRREWERA